jgi:hypothetical protein
LEDRGYEGEETVLKLYKDGSANIFSVVLKDWHVEKRSQ